MRAYYSTYLTLLVLVVLYTDVALPSSIQPRHTVEILFTHQSGAVTGKQWLTIFTLALAPLVAHIVFGLAPHVVLRSEGPKWTDSLVHFNPVSIIWRYYAIADRRFRARKWDQADMAACNAVFWDGTKWDGSEAMMIRSRNWVTKLPTSSHVEIVSGSTLATIAVTLQGIQAIAEIVGGIVPRSGYHIGNALPVLFQPLAVMGLLRLQAACWLSNDYGFTRIDQWQCPENEPERNNADGEFMKRSVETRLVDYQTPRGIIFRVWWVLSLLALTGTVFTACADALSPIFRPKTDPYYLSASAFTMLLMYLLLCGGLLVIHCTYILKRHGSSTVLPCIQSLWYKCYTFLLVAAATTCVVLGALETRIMFNGDYTSYPDIECDDGGNNCLPVSLSVSLIITNISTAMP